MLGTNGRTNRRNRGSPEFPTGVLSKGEKRGATGPLRMGETGRRRLTHSLSSCMSGDGPWAEEVLAPSRGGPLQELFLACDDSQVRTFVDCHSWGSALSWHLVGGGQCPGARPPPLRVTPNPLGRQRVYQLLMDSVGL